MATQTRKNTQQAPDEVTLVKGDDRRTVKSVDDVVRLKFDGYTVEKAGAKSVVADQKPDQK